MRNEVFFMDHLQNLHTHTTYCDGKDTPEEMVLAAIEQGFDSIGFSEHGASGSPMAPDEAKLAEYRREVRELAKKYEGRIDIFCGLEFDTDGKAPLDGYDYVIGSMHYVYKDGVRLPADGSVEKVRNAINDLYGGRGLDFALDYFEKLASLPDYGRFDIVGHFDLVSKNCERADFFDVNDPRYIQAGLAAIDAIAGKIPFFEVNTGAISRGYRTTPYPAPAFLRALRERGFGAIISSDCHDARNLRCGFDDAAALLRANGFTERYILTKGGFEVIPL